MVNILHNRYDVAAEWMQPVLREYIQPDMRVLVAALSYRDDRIRCAADWDSLYAPGGTHCEGIARSFSAYGISPKQIRFINPFSDSAASAQQKVRLADVIYLPGGLPDRMYERLRLLGLTGVLKEHTGIMIGCSAGAVIQLSEYHLTPDRDYPEFRYYPGLDLLDDFYVEVHYEGADIQHSSIARVLKERNKPVYALPDDSVLIAENGRIRTSGPVRVFKP